MRHDPAKVAECYSWLGRAWADLDSAAILLGAARPHPDTALFHCQQAVEKAWKAFLFWHDVPFRKTHDLRELEEACSVLDSSLQPLAVAPRCCSSACITCSVLDSSLQPLAEQAEDLTQFAWLLRYPGEPEEPAREEATAALALAQAVYNAVLARLPAEVRPNP